MVSYTDVGGCVEYLSKATIEEALPSLVGCPLTIGHPKGRFNSAEVSQGTVDLVGFDAASGWYFCEGSVETERARTRLRNNSKPSCGYEVLELGPGGTRHNVPYARELTKIHFNHLALVQNPRYEDASSRLNSKSPMKLIQKIFGKKKQDDGTEVDTTDTRENQISPETKLDLGDGKTATVAELVEAQHRHNAAQVTAVGAEDVIEFDGQRYNAKDLVATFKAQAATPPAQTPEEIAAAAAAETQRQNAVQADADRKAQEARENEKKQKGAESYQILGAARHNAAVSDSHVTSESSGSSLEQLAVGQSRYGSGLRSVKADLSRN